MRNTFALIVALLILPVCSMAQLAERPGNSTDDPIESPRDLSGLSIKNPRVRVVHTTDSAKRGGSMYLQQVDPWLGYQWGRNLTQREFRQMDGVYGDAGKIDGIILPDGATKMMTRGHVNSCAICHNTPYRDGGAGATIAKNGGEGRNTPHMFGAGLLEMIGIELRLRALAIADANHDGWISPQEAKGKRCIVSNLPDDMPGEKFQIDLGSFEENPKTHRPALNPLLNPIFVDKHGKRIAWASSLKTDGVAGYTFETQIFGFGHLFAPWRPPVSTTLRSFIATPFDIHMGMQAFDPTTLNDPDGDGFSQYSNAGALQCLTAAGKDRGARRGPTGISLDDPDRDGYCEEITEGELDVAEWYLLNHPAPARGKITDEVKRGEKLFADVGCTSCHVPDWHIAADRRFFELQVAWNDTTDRLEGKLNLLAHRDGDRLIPSRNPFTVRGIYSDFKYHDLGQDFAQMQYDGSIVKLWRTSPLWGVGSTAPYGHDGASLSLDDVIRRHRGEAFDSRNAYVSLNSFDRSAILSFLSSLMLYQTDRLPTDIDGDGRISEHFVVAGVCSGLERFNPEWLFKTPGKIEGPITNVRGEKITSFALTNVRAAYGLDLDYLKDCDNDCFPDIIDPAPSIPGFLDGLNSPKEIWHAQLRP
ncbi:MAG TPA: di-heme oxidoredictase family protein [Tepidisphaeraceae bacterium]|jgi:hypothetical protein|nr:di-heme oxidoredictase family protein [Tepidisphaeraceae bacterium]